MGHIQGVALLGLRLLHLFCGTSGEAYLLTNPCTVPPKKKTSSGPLPITIFFFFSPTTTPGNRNPRHTFSQACTSLVGFSIGDFLAQKGTSKEKFSYERLARMAAFGFLFHGT